MHFYKISDGGVETDHSVVLAACSLPSWRPTLPVCVLILLCPTSQLIFLNAPLTETYDLGGPLKGLEQASYGMAAWCLVLVVWLLTSLLGVAVVVVVVLGAGWLRTSCYRLYRVCPPQFHHDAFLGGEESCLLCLPYSLDRACPPFLHSSPREIRSSSTFIPQLTRLDLACITESHAPRRPPNSALETCAAAN